MTLEEIIETLKEYVWSEFLAKAGVTEDDFANWHRNGMPAEWAKNFAEATPIPASAWPKVIHPPKLLQKPRRLSIVDNTTMEDSHRLAISRGRSTSKVDAAFKAAYRSKGHTLTTLSAAVDCDISLLSKYRRKLRPIPQERAERIARIIPWPADGKHWPGGIVPKD